MSTSRVKPGQGGYRVLFWALAAMMVLRPFIQEVGTRPWVFPVFFTVVLLAGAWAVSPKRYQLIGLALLGLTALITLWADLLSLDFVTDAVSSIAAMLYLGWITIILAMDVFRERERVSADMIYGAINVYLLIGLTFAMAHLAQVILVPGSIGGLDAHSPVGDAIYYSFVTLTTLGYGDMSPLTDNARMLASSEAVLGQLFIAVLLAKLVAVHIAGRDKDPAS